MLAFVLVNAVLLTPKTRVLVLDLTKPTFVKTIDNVPVGVAFPLYITTSIGTGIARTYDTFFAQPRDVQYSQTGLLFGQRLMEESFYLEPDKDVLHENLGKYAARCIAERKLINNDDWEALKNSPNLLTTLYSGSKIDYVDYKQKVNAPSTLLSCADAGKLLAGELNTLASGNSITAKIMKRLGLSSASPNGFAPPASSGNIDLIQQYFMGISASAADIYKQNMLVNVYRTALSNYPSLVGGTAQQIAISSEQTLTKLRLSHLTSYQMAGNILPALHTTFLTLMIGIFPIMVLALFILEISWAVVKNCLSFLLSLMMWPVLFAIFNSIINTLTAQVMHGEAFTLSSMDRVKENAASIAGIASWMMLSIPFISFKLVTNLGQSLVGLASSFGSVLASATSADAGNTAAGNYNWGNMQMENINGNKVDINRMIRQGMSSHQLENGAMKTITQNGAMVLDSAGAISNLPFKVNWSQVVDQSRAEAAQDVHRQTEMYQQGYNSAVTDVVNTAKTIAKNYSVNELVQQGYSLDQARAIHQVAQHGINADENVGSGSSTSQQDSTQTTRTTNGEASINASLGLPQLVKLVGGGDASVGGKLGYDVQDSNTDGISKTRSADSSFKTGENWSISSSGDKSDRFNESHSGSTSENKLSSLAKTFNEAVNRANTSFSNYTSSNAREKVLTNSSTLTESQRLAIDYNLSNEFVNFARARLGDDNVAMLLTSGTSESRQKLEPLIQEFGEQLTQRLRDIHDNAAENLLGGNFNNVNLQSQIGGQTSGIGLTTNYNNSLDHNPPKGFFDENQMRNESQHLGVSGKVESVDKNKVNEINVAYAKQSGLAQANVDAAKDSYKIQNEENNKRFNHKE